MLTEKQKNVAEWLVAQKESGKLGEEFLFIWAAGWHTFIVLPSGEELKIYGIDIDDGVFHVLSEHGLLICTNQNKHTLHCTFKQKLFDIVKNNFHEMPSQATSENIKITAYGHGHQITVKSPYSAQTITSYKTQDYETIECILQEILSIASRIEPPERDEIEADVSTIQAQINSPKPKKMIVKESILSLQGVASSLVASGIYGAATNVDKLTMLFEQLWNVCTTLLGIG